LLLWVVVAAVVDATYKHRTHVVDAALHCPEQAVLNAYIITACQCMLHLLRNIMVLLCLCIRT
jgi:hypothetical protein